MPRAEAVPRSLLIMSTSEAFRYLPTFRSPLRNTNIHRSPPMKSSNVPSKVSSRGLSRHISKKVRSLHFWVALS